MTDLHEVQFQWPHSEPTSVIVTGTFDQWSSSMQLTKGPNGFRGSTKIPWDEKIAYKFIVDEQWTVVEHEPTEFDHDGNINNVYIAPHKPSSSALDAVLEAAPPLKEKGSELVGYTNANHSAESGKTTGEPEAASGPRFPQIVADLIDTVAAREGTTSASGSGLGAVMQSVVGIDPINAEQIAIPSPKSDARSGVFEEHTSAPVQGVEPPDVPTTVNVSGNNTTVGDTTPHTGPKPASPVEANTEDVTPVIVQDSITVWPSSSQPPHTNGHGDSAPAAAHVEEVKVQGPSTLMIPKKPHQPIPSNSPSRSPKTSSSSTAESAAHRRKKRSIFGKLKHLFLHDKDEATK